jgi:probable HAF family extracellular repeat protein
MHKLSTLAGAVIVLSLTSVSAFSEAIYRLTELEGRGDSFLVRPNDINDSGQVTGLARNSFGSRAFLWNGKWKRDLGTLGVNFVHGEAINASGQVAGTATNSDGHFHAFLWDRGVMQDLGTLGTDSFTEAMNDAGQVVGVSYTGNTAQPQHAFLWDGATMRDLGTLGGVSCIASAINASGQVAGTATTSGGDSHAFLWDRSVMQDLGTLGGRRSYGGAMNDAGWVTGFSNTTNDASRHAFLWDGRRMRDLGTLGGQFSAGTDINATGQVAGTSWIGNTAEVQHAFLWDGASMHDLGTFGGSNSFSWAINAAGQVTGSADLATGDHRQHAFLWDNGTLHDLNDLIDPEDPLKFHVIVEVGMAINDRGYIVATGFDSRATTFDSPAYLLSPAAPDDLRARNVMRDDDRVVRLVWSDRFADETRFLVERSPVTNQRCSAFTPIGSRGENATVFRDYTVSPNTEYCYQLRIIRSTVVHTLSNIARITTRR